MPDEIIRVPLQTDPHAAAVTFLSVLAYPDDRKNREKMQFAGWAYLLYRKIEDDPEWAWRPQTIVPGLLRADYPSACNDLKKGEDKIWRRSLPAVEIGANLLGKKLFEDFPNIRVGSRVIKFEGPVVEVERLSGTKGYHKKKLPASVNSLSDWMAEHLNNNPNYRGNAWTGKNVDRRIWAPTLPGLHLGFALRGFLLKEARQEIRSIFYLIEHADEWIEKAVVWAECFRQAYREQFISEHRDALCISIIPNDRPVLVAESQERFCDP